MRWTRDSKDSLGNTVTVGNGQIGSVDLFAKQADFYGTVRAEGGITLAFNAANGDALMNAKSVVLQSGANGEETTLAFNDTNQTFRNFEGDAATRLSLGRGTVTLVQSADLVYAGKVTGVGGFVKAGAGDFSIVGRDAVGGTATTYAGATVVREGALVLGGANQLVNSSGLVLSGGRVQFASNQTFGALFGASSSVLELGSSTLTIGLTDARLAQVRDESANFTSYAPGYFLATEGTSTLPGSVAVSGYGADTTQTFLRSVLGTTDTAHIIAANADYINALAFAGKLVGNGTLVKQGGALESDG